ncbi:MAG: BlaI/MecI/CopY family transcriptional regulator [Clostridia bacterium]|nr:BlaI/MecI/CopY family transcriptional regulator [Clostridia bacterium]
MKPISLSDGEWKLMNLLWDKNPRTISEMVKELKLVTGWTKATVNIMLNRLADKGAVSIDASGHAKLFFPIIERDDAVMDEARATLGKIKAGGIGLLVSTMARESELSDSDIDELYRILKEAKKK